jgi:hypothetical protein
VPSWRCVARRVPSQGTPGSARKPEAAGQAKTSQAPAQAEAGASRPDGRGRGNMAANRPPRQQEGHKTVDSNRYYRVLSQ